MKKIAFKWLLVLGLTALVSECAWAQSAGKRGIGGFSLIFGEAYQPANYRFTLSSNDLDFGLTSIPVTMFYVGSRNFVGNSYVGYGAGFFRTFGFYGSIGYEACAVVCVGAEFIGGGDTSGRSNAYATISLGMLW